MNAPIASRLQLNVKEMSGVTSFHFAWQDRCEFTWRVAVAQAVKRFGQALDDHDAKRDPIACQLPPRPDNSPVLSPN